jgi:hypothetical protein
LQRGMQSLQDVFLPSFHWLVSEFGWLDSQSCTFPSFCYFSNTP